MIVKKRHYEAIAGNFRDSTRFTPAILKRILFKCYFTFNTVYKIL